MKAVFVLLLVLVAGLARAADDLQYEQAAYADNAADASEADTAVAEQSEAEQLDVESQAVADAANQEAEVEMADVSEAEEQEQAAAEQEFEEEQGEVAEEAEGEEQEQVEGEEQEQEQALVESDALPKLLRHPAKSLSSLAHKAASGIKKLRRWVAKRQKRGARGGAPPPKPGKGKKWPRRLPGKHLKRRPVKAVGPRPKGVRPQPRPKAPPRRKGAKRHHKKKHHKKGKGRKHLKRKGKPAPRARKHKRKHKLRVLRPWARRPRRRPRKVFIPKRKVKKIKRPPPPPTPDDRIWHSERWVAKEHDPNQDPEMAKLNLALAAVKEDILATNKQINDERRWSIAVHKIVQSYKGKVGRVDAHIIALRKEMKALYRKKKQIENLKLQRALEAKLKEARAELTILTNSLKHVAIKQGQLNRSGMDLRATIAGIQGQLAKLRGQHLFKKKKKCGKGKRYSKKHRKCVKKKGKKGKKHRKHRKGRKARKAARKLKRMLKRKL